MYKIDRRGLGGWSKNRSLGQTHVLLRDRLIDKLNRLNQPTINE